MKAARLFGKMTRTFGEVTILFLHPVPTLIWRTTVALGTGGREELSTRRGECAHTDAAFFTILSGK